MLHLGESVRARALGQEPPKDGYQGDYVADLAVEISGAGDESLDIHELTDRVVAHMLVGIKATMERYGVAYDRYFSERTLHEGSPSLVQRSLDAMRAAGHIYESDDAIWLRTTSFRRRQGPCAGAQRRRADLLHTLTSPTCRASASAASSARSSCSAPTTTATVARLKAAFEALGGDPELLETQIMQMVHLVENDERTRMSKRRGEFVTLDSLLDEIGVDATRFFMLQSSHVRTLDLDLDLARSQTSENPVFYVQYAHARIASILGTLGEARVAAAVAAGAQWSSPSGELHPSERELIMSCWRCPRRSPRRGEARPAPHRQLRAGAGAGVHRLLPRLAR